MPGPGSPGPALGSRETCLLNASDKRETKVFPVPVLLISGPLETIGGGVPNQSAQRGITWGFLGVIVPLSSHSPSAGPRGSESLERLVVKPFCYLFPGWPSPYGQAGVAPVMMI